MAVWFELENINYIKKVRVCLLWQIVTIYMAKVSSLSRYRFSSSSRSNPVKRSSLLTGNCCLMAVYAHAGKGILLFRKIPYTSLENSRYETLRRKLEETAESNVL